MLSHDSSPTVPGTPLPRQTKANGASDSSDPVMSCSSQATSSRSEETLSAGSGRVRLDASTAGRPQPVHVLQELLLDPFESHKPPVIHSSIRVRLITSLLRDEIGLNGSLGKKDPIQLCLNLPVRK